MRMIVALATILGLDFWSIDIQQAYLQSSTELHRTIFIRPKMNILRFKLIHVIKSLYCLTGRGDYWCETFAKFHLHNLRMKQNTEDFALFSPRELGKLVALSGTYFDDVLQAGTKEAKQSLRAAIKEKFEVTSFGHGTIRIHRFALRLIEPQPFGASLKCTISGACARCLPMRRG